MKGIYKLPIAVVVLAFVVVGATTNAGATTPSPSSSSKTVVKNEQEQHQKQDNNQSVNITTNTQTADLSTSTIKANEPRKKTVVTTKGGEDVDVDVDTKGATRSATVSATLRQQPSTGISLLAISTLAGTGAAGYALTRFRKGKGFKKDETLSEFASHLGTHKR